MTIGELARAESGAEVYSASLQQQYCPSPPPSIEAAFYGLHLPHFNPTTFVVSLSNSGTPHKASDFGGDRAFFGLAHDVAERREISALRSCKMSIGPTGRRLREIQPLADHLGGNLPTFFDDDSSERAIDQVGLSRMACRVAPVISIDVLRQGIVECLWITSRPAWCAILARLRYLEKHQICPHFSQSQGAARHGFCPVVFVFRWLQEIQVAEFVGVSIYL